MDYPLYMFIRRTPFGAWDIDSNFAHSQMYVGYSKREAIKKYREEHGVKGKHITIMDM